MRLKKKRDQVKQLVPADQQKTATEFWPLSRKQLYEEPKPCASLYDSGPETMGS